MKSANLWRRVEKLINEDGDSCSVCGKAFPHVSETYYGEVEGGGVAVVGSCCVGKLKTIVGAGLYLKPVRAVSTRCH
jgi:hypothetical protein